MLASIAPAHIPEIKLLVLVFSINTWFLKYSNALNLIAYTVLIIILR